MKTQTKQIYHRSLLLALSFWLLAACSLSYAQVTPAAPAAPAAPVAPAAPAAPAAPVAPAAPAAAPALVDRTPIERVKNTFRGSFLIDNQSVMVPVKNALEFSIQHRFGTINNKYNDIYGVFAPANIRLGLAFVPIDNLQLGFGLTKERMQWDGNIKYALTKQAASNSGCPISVTYYGDMAISTIPKAGNFVSDYDRISYFNQLIIARKVTSAFSIQVAPSLTYFNNVEGYLDAEGAIKPKMNNAHYAIATSGSYMVTDGMGIIANYDQPLTQHPEHNPRPNVSFGIQFVTMSHTFQIFCGNFQSILPQSNNFFNQNDFTQSRYLIGFNITKRFYL